MKIKWVKVASDHSGFLYRTRDTGKFTSWRRIDRDSANKGRSCDHKGSQGRPFLVIDEYGDILRLLDTKTGRIFDTGLRTVGNLY